MHAGWFAAVQVNFSRAGIIEAVVGERLSFECSAPGNHISELMEIGQTLTIDEQMLSQCPTTWKPYSHLCANLAVSLMKTAPHCSKMINMTVTADMVGKSYQCRSLIRVKMTPTTTAREAIYNVCIIVIPSVVNDDNQYHVILYSEKYWSGVNCSSGSDRQW